MHGENQEFLTMRINLEQKLEYKGYWYLPSFPNNKVAGILAYYPNEKITLELIGCFDDALLSLFSNNEEMVIYGETSDAKEITLFQCFQCSSVNFSADFPIVRYNCRFIIIGKHVNSLDEKARYWVSFRIPELTYWCHPRALRHFGKYDEKGSEITQMGIVFNSVCDDNENVISEVEIDDNTSILIKRGVDFDGTNELLNPQFKQYTYVDIIKKAETSIKELLFDIYIYESFISLASFSVVKSTDITFFDKDIFQQDQSGKHYREIHLIHQYNKLKNGNDQNKNIDFLFQYTTIEDVYPEIIKKWYNAPIDLYPIRSHLIDSLEKKSVYGSVDFLIIVQAIEGFWWRFREADYKKNNAISKSKETKLRTILKELLKEFSDIELLSKHKIDIEAIVDSRHYYSHFFESTKRPKKLDGMLLFKQTKKLRILLICCMLSFVGFEHSKIDVIFKVSNNKFV